MRVAVDGIYFGLLPGRGPEELIRLAVDVGADGLNWPYHADYGADDPEPIARAIADAGLAVVSLAMTPHLSAVPGSEAAFRESLARCLSAAAVFNTRVIDCWPALPKDVAKEQAQAVLAANLDALAPAAAAAGRVLSFEFEPGATIERYGEAGAFVAPFGPAAALTADTYHIIRIGDDLAQAATALGPTIGILHFSGSHRGEPGSEGDRCDYAAFLRAACRAGYAGDIVLQYEPPEDAVGSLKRAIALTREVIREVGLT